MESAKEKLTNSVCLMLTSSEFKEFMWNTFKNELITGRSDCLSYEREIFNNAIDYIAERLVVEKEGDKPYENELGHDDRDSENRCHRNDRGRENWHRNSRVFLKSEHVTCVWG